MIDTENESNDALDLMDLAHLRSFVAVADAGSMALAARLLHVSQPTLSRQIRNLERDLGVQVFDRIGRRIVLAADGREMLARSRRLLAEVESFRERATALGGGKAGVLRVGATPQFLEAAMPHVLALYRRRNPEVKITLVEDGASPLVRGVEQGELHLAIGVARYSEPLESVLLYPLRVLAVMSRRHRLASRRTLAVADVAHETLLMLAPGFQTRQLFEEACQQIHPEPRVLLESRSPQSLIALAAAGHGIAIVPSVVAFNRVETATAGLVGNGQPLGTWVRAVWDPRRYLPPYGETFLRVLVNYTRRSYPGHRLSLTREVRRPPDGDAVPAGSGGGAQLTPSSS
jgi:DNA-binding transcriptional LysR family regulator